MRSFFYAAVMISGATAAVWLLVHPRQPAEAAVTPEVKLPAPFAVSTSSGSVSATSLAQVRDAVEPGAGADSSPPPGAPMQMQSQMDALFEAEREDLSAQLRNRDFFQGVFRRLDYEAGFAGSNFQCRGNRCRGQLLFKDLDQAHAVLNEMDKDPGWNDARVEYQAVRDTTHGADGDTPRYIVYFRTGATNE